MNEATRLPSDNAGEPVADLVTDPVVNLVYAEPGEDSCVSVSGIAAVIEDAAKNCQLFKMAKAAITGTPPTGMGEQGEIRMH